MSAQGVVSAASDACCDTALETVLAIWHEVLASAGGLDADSNFFLCGGDSLDLMRVLVRVRERLGVALDLRDVGSFSTPRRMAQCCARAGVRHADAAISRAAARTKHVSASHVAAGHWAATDAGPHSHRTVPDSFVCSAGQHALWLAEQLGGDCGLYNTAVAIHFTGALQVPLLARSLGLLLRRHEVLRCSLQYDSRNRQLLAHVAAPGEVRLEADCVSTDMMREHLLDAAAQPFDLEHGPLWRARLLRIGMQRWTLLLCLHHAVTDGWSGHVLLHDLAENYRALLHDPAPQSRQPQCIDTEFRRWCVRHTPAAVDAGWWQRYLAGADRLPSWPPTGTARWPFVMALEQCVLPDTMQAGVQRMSREQGLRPAALFLAALRLAVLDLGGIGELCVGMPANVRDDSAQDAAVGYFVNLLVLRERVEAANAGIETVRMVQRSLDEALRHRMDPFAELARALKPVPLPSGNVWSDIVFAFQNLPRALPDFGGIDVRIEALAPPHGQYPLKVEVLCGAMGYMCRIEYARECLTQRDARGLLEAFQRRIAALLDGAARNS